ncbi:uncharacterized protein LOC121407971 isoform X1 [Lytechinus variegatus]|uniref:uncharacterized protein LOC121407971 isoform X1 n=2 Tax=Lytechinus variegatus TaxID=7654 RepID=UPI001BB13B2A|nr:uncharacterized protein LOC121407971 isoform X1 [Lytechinus variegatus]
MPTFRTYSRMHCQTRITVFCFLYVFSITSSSSLPKSAHPRTNRKHMDLTVRSVKETDADTKSLTKIDSEALADFPSIDEEYSMNSIVDDGPIYTCEEIFQMTDLNEDGRVTEAEYRQANPNMTDLEMSFVFQRYDPDCDGNIYIENLCGNIVDGAGIEIEMGVAGQLPDPMEVNCRTLSMQICDKESFLVVWEQIEAEETADNTLCRALQTHIECVSRENKYCGLDDYVADVKQTVASFIRSGICPNIHVNEETVSGIPSSGVRQVRSAKNGHRSRHSNSLRNTDVDPTTLLRSSHTCLRSTMEPCNTNFISSLRSGNVDPCETLVDYRRCARKSTRRCQDRTNAMRIRDGIKSITRAHRKAKLCVQ